jgi:hypothetical protein
MNDNDLDRLIRESSPAPRFPASFQREVWSRIAGAQSRSLSGRFQHLLGDWGLWLAKPSAAVATIMVMLLVGAGLGGIAPDTKSEQAMKRAYTTSINPILAAHDAPAQ